MSKKLFGVSALFDTPDAIIHAAEKVADAGFEKFDVHTPYPVHGMDQAMKLKPSKLPFVPLVVGLFGGIFGFFFQYYTKALDYPLQIGGKPDFAWPAFMPITFEFTVLLGGLSTFFAMVAFFMKLPHNSHPLHDTDYMKSVISDKYGVVIESEDKNFNEEKIISFLGQIGGHTVTPIYFESET